jgi:GNAT superfamily N-acetyltransferase
MLIQKAETADLPRILEVQRLAYQEQAWLCNDFEIPPLTETLGEVLRVFPSLVMLKAVDDNGDIVGSVRGRPEGGTCHVGRLFVHPDHQGTGIGTRLLREIEKECPCPRYELFTSSKSLKNLRFYEYYGYRRFAEKPYSPEYAMVYMEK